MEQVNLEEMSFTDLMDIYTTRCEELGQTPDESFKTKEVLIEAINKFSTAQNGEDKEEQVNADGTKQQKYNSTGKRGPNQGIGAFAKEQIALGKTNAEILAMIAEQYPTARTSTSCIAYYRNAVKKGGSVTSKGGVAGDPAALRAKAAELIAQAEQLEKQIAEAAVKGDIESKIREEVEARIRAEVEAKYAEVLAAQKKAEEEKDKTNPPPVDEANQQPAA